MSSPDTVTSATFGFTPRLYPRPAYPPFSAVLHNFFLTAIFQAGVVGATLATVLFPVYIWALALMAEWGLGDAAAFSVLLSLTHTLTYVSFNGFTMGCHYFGWGRRYALPRAHYMVPTRGLSEYSVTIIMPPMGAPLPSPARLFVGCLAAFLVNEWGFYWVHRLMHTTALYATCHKEHHEYVGTLGIAAEHSGVIESIFSAQVPTITGALVFGGHPFVVVLWLGIRLQQTYEVHSGFSLHGTIMDSLGISHGAWAAHHDFHHTSNRGNFGSFTCDWLFGTMDMYIQAGMADGYLARRGKS